MNDWSIESRQDRFLAALCHLSGIVPLYGLDFSAVVWAAARVKRRGVALQALQALIAQVVFHVALLVPLLGVLLAWCLRKIGAPMVSVVSTLNFVLTDVLFVVAELRLSKASDGGDVAMGGTLRVAGHGVWPVACIGP